MPSTYTASDNEFATASGANLNYNSDWSRFDGAPSNTSNLTITSNEGDLDPNTFETGETYDLKWEGDGGGAIEDAVVIRSDYLGSEQGIIVFEGTNSATGAIAHIVWTPSVDLESWYHSNGGDTYNQPGFWTSNQDGDDFQFACYGKGTMIETPDGPRLVETLRAGDFVLTLDHGPQEILWTHVGDQPLGDADLQSKPVLIGAGALGNNRPTRDLIVSPMHRILVGGHGQVETVFGRECLAPAKALTGLPGIRFMNGKREITWVHFACAHHEVVVANGCISESLLLGPMALQSLTQNERAQVIQLFGNIHPQKKPLNGHAARKCLGVGPVRRRIEAQRNRKKLRMKQKSKRRDVVRSADGYRAKLAGPMPSKQHRPDLRL
ncbi:Hint domain protein [Antarctobacter heliothermus]|uniref:Hint domain protein n=1 Tax=Antarctobacter heliothermus TaxID=74033 RepID=A0A222E4J4_9RHOB|nr:Hint domain-containing protein [Antarctobacter heliothermus]ASP21126.1 Hint domain protein [Antarctobacter heliothermus]